MKSEREGERGREGEREREEKRERSGRERYDRLGEAGRGVERINLVRQNRKGGSERRAVTGGVNWWYYLASWLTVQLGLTQSHPSGVTKLFLGRLSCVFERRERERERERERGGGRDDREKEREKMRKRVREREKEGDIDRERDREKENE